MATNALIVLQGLATGSLLYVVFFEILEKERQKSVPGVLQVRRRTGTYSDSSLNSGIGHDPWLHFHGPPWFGRS
jgi:hypothetical protein